MYKLRVGSYDKSFYRDLPRKAQQEMLRQMQTSAQKNIQREAQRILGEEPPPARHKFQFGSQAGPGADRSRRFFFWKFKGTLPRPRSHRLAQSWFARVGTYFGPAMVVIYNAMSYAKWVYPPLPPQIRGHANTGWGSRWPQRVALVIAIVQAETGKAWLASIQKVIGG